jgi:hypothetical protein
LFFGQEFDPCSAGAIENLLLSGLRKSEKSAEKSA